MGKDKTVKSVGIFEQLSCQQILLERMSSTVPKTDGPRNFITNWSNAPTANPIFAYFKFLTNLRATVRLVVPITNQLSASWPAAF